MKDKTCELCGSKVKVVGKTTMHYEPVESRVASEEEIVTEILRYTQDALDPTYFDGIAKALKGEFIILRKEVKHEQT